jgi:transcriptional regulator with XRE-family HTH domain
VAEEEVEFGPTFEHTEVGDQLRLAADRLGFNKNQLSKLSGVSRRHITLAFQGANISLSILKKLARVLDLSIITLGDLSLKSETPPVDAAVLDHATKMLDDAERQVHDALTLLRRRRQLRERAVTAITNATSETRAQPAGDGEQRK